MYAERVEKSVGLRFLRYSRLCVRYSRIDGGEYQEVSLTGYFRDMIRRHRDEDYGFQNR